MTKLNKVPDLLGNNLLPNNEAQCAYQRENSKQSENVGQLEKFRSSQYFAAQVNLFIRFIDYYAVEQPKNFAAHW